MIRTANRYRVIGVTPSRTYGATVTPLTAWLTFDQAATLAGHWQEHTPAGQALNVQERFTGRIVSALDGTMLPTRFSL